MRATPREPRVYIELGCRVCASRAANSVFALLSAASQLAVICSPLAVARIPSMSMFFSGSTDISSLQEESKLVIVKASRLLRK